MVNTIEGKNLSEKLSKAILDQLPHKGRYRAARQILDLVSGDEGEEPGSQ
jgi:hypothetical protein